MGFPHRSHPRETPVLSKHFGDVDARSLAGWRQRGGYRALEQALAMEPVAITNIVKESGLRGRGGAGFPCGAFPATRSSSSASGAGCTAWTRHSRTSRA